ncbi:MAG: hypothetical protein ACI9FU_001461 [Granulosicoccus sp.]|jgi:hypothetical protein
MRKTLLFVAAGLLSGLSYGQMMPNMGFENWETFGGYTEPVDWNTANECAAQISIVSVTESNDAHSGASSARLETKDFLMALKVNGVVTTATMICDPSNPGQVGGYSETARPDSMVFWAKYTPVQTDNAYCQVIFFGAGGDTDTISYDKHDVMGTVANWTRYSFPISWMTADNPTEASVLFNSSWGNGNENQGFEGSVFLVDDVEWTMTEPESVPEGEAQKWKLSPNPVSDFMTVTGTAKGGQLEVYNITGERVGGWNLGAFQSTINLSELPAGLYLYQLNTRNNEPIKTGKFLVKD